MVTALEDLLFDILSSFLVCYVSERRIKLANILLSCSSIT